MLKPLNFIANEYQHLALPELGAELASRLQSCQREFFKLERRQDFQEPYNASYVAFTEHGLDEARKVLTASPLPDADLYEMLAKKRVLFNRVRLLELPMSEYLKWEMMAYQQIVKYGERIFINDITAEPESSALKSSHDFFMFDDSAVIVNDYSAEGIFQGGWLIECPNEVAKYVEIAELSFRESKILGTFEFTDSN